MTKSKKQPEKKADKPKVTRFEIEKLGANCVELFNVSGSTFAGATYGLKGRYSVEEMKQIIEDWKKKGVN